MAYVVKSTEKVRGIGADYETKAMLYLMTCREDSYKIYCFAIDFYNDVTGLDLNSQMAWDVQSKGTKNGSAKDIGRELVTLFKNFISDLKFDYLILFMAAVPGTFRIDNNLTTFGINNIRERALNSLKLGLKEECLVRKYIDNEMVTEENIDKFLDAVTFVVDNKTKADYIRNIIKVSPKYIPKEDVLEAIFDEIKAAQSAKKNGQPVENEIITKLSDVWYYDRCLKTKEIRLMVLNRFINGDLMNKGVPVYFIPCISNYNSDGKKDIIEDCQLLISKVLFNKEQTDTFWDFLDVVSDAVASNPSLDTKQIYGLLEKNPKVLNAGLDVLSIQYVISVMKEALETDVH